MTDEEILDEVYQMLVEKECGFSSEMRKVQSFIEQEWQKQDDNELSNEQRKKRNDSFIGGEI
jgi:hypothetical protein